MAFGRIKLDDQDKVEVRSVEIGLLGSWHPGIVVGCKSCDQGMTYVVKYVHILVDEGSGHFVDNVYVPNHVDENSCSTSDAYCYRGRIRPLPSLDKAEKRGLSYGRCVDVFHDDGWWEGVVFDHEDGSEKRNIFFPDLGDELIKHIDDIRITWDWNDVNDTWAKRGRWLFLELIEEFEQKSYIPVSIKQLWYDLREKKTILKLGEWTSRDKAMWRNLVSEAIDDNCKVLMDHLLQALGFAEEQGGYSVVPSTRDAIYAVSTTNKEGFSSPNACKTDGKNSSSTRSKCKWLPAVPDVVPGAEYCPDAVIKYTHGKKLQTDIDVIRKHLLYLKWKIEYRKKNNCNEFRYISPGRICYYSLRKVCLILGKSNADTPSVVQNEYTSLSCSPSLKSQDTDTSLFTLPGNSSSLRIEQPAQDQEFLVSSSSDSVAICSKYCLEAPLSRNQYSCVRKLKKGEKKERTQRAKNHLAALRWQFKCVNHNGRSELRYIAPEGRRSFNSPQMACQYSLEKTTSTLTKQERKMISKNVKGQSATEKISSALRKMGSNKLENRSSNFSCDKKLRKTTMLPELGGSDRIQKKRKEGLLLSFCPHQQEGNPDGQNLPPQMRKGTKFRGSCKSKVNKKGTRPTHVLRSSKRVQQVGVFTPSNQKSRTVLSWLIENNIVLPRDRVYYCSRKGRRAISEGRITCDGIKCNCCGKVYTVSKFELHVCGRHIRPAASIFLEDGRSLLDRQKQIVFDEMKNFAAESSEMLKGYSYKGENDNICSICRYGGDLVLCDQCPSSFHKTCLGLEDIPDGDWFCPSCCCRICVKNKQERDDQHFVDDNYILTCTQCEKKYHIGCLRNGGDSFKCSPKEDWFCCTKCKEIFLGLQKLLGKPLPVGVDDLTWTLLKTIQSDKFELDSPDTDTLIENHIKLNVALDVMHECFEPVEEPYTRRDLLKDVLFSRESKLNRLNFQGFYTVVLQKGDEFVTVATLRVYGEKVAEVPLVGTSIQYRRLGMCRILMNFLEKKLMELGVERLTLPAVPSVLNAWTGSFGFTRMTDSERLKFLDYTFLDFPDTIMCHKLLIEKPCRELSTSREVEPRTQTDDHRSADTTDNDRSGAICEALEADQMEGGITEQRLGIAAFSIGSVVEEQLQLHQVAMVCKQLHHQVSVINSTEPHAELFTSETDIAYSVDESPSSKEERKNCKDSSISCLQSRYDTVPDLKCYKRRKTLSCGAF